MELIESSSAARLPTTWGTFKAYCYKSHFDGIEHVAMVKVISLRSDRGSI